MRYGSVCSGIEAATVAWHGNGKDRRGQRYGKLVVTDFAGRHTDGHLLWKCKCDCGQETTVQSNNFRTDPRKGTKSCGCLRSEVAKHKPRSSWNKGKTYSTHGEGREYKNKKAWADAVIREKGNGCEKCGWDKARCDAHHKVPRSEGGRNTIENGEVLCPNCHRLHHEVSKSV